VKNWDAQTVRAEFPALAVHPALAFLDNAATTQKPTPVLEAMQRALIEDCANVHRGGGLIASRATLAFEAARSRVAQWMGAAPEEVIFTSGCTDALNGVAYALGEAVVHPGDEVVVSVLEHHSNYLPWQALAQRRGARLVELPLSPEGGFQLAELERALNARTRIVALSHVSNVTGQRLPIAQVAQRVHAAGALLVVDGAQAAAHGPLDVRTLGVDAYAVSAHKLYGPFGIGALYLRAELAARLGPWRMGGGMVTSVEALRFEPAEPPRRFEAGTPNFSGAIGFAAALTFLENLGWEAVRQYEQELVLRAEQVLGALPGVQLIGPGERESLCSFSVAGVHPHDVATVLETEGVQVRAGQLCAQPLLRWLRQAAVVRASFAVYNTGDEIDRLAAGITRAQRLLA
jgi:cysteine desulfurase / selenocysteine lyase